MAFRWLCRRFSCQEGKRLARLLGEYKDQLEKEYSLKQDLFMYLRENDIVVKEKPLSRDIKLELTLSYKNFIITFRAGKYDRIDQIHEKKIENFFPFQVSYNVKYEACLFECYAAKDNYAIVRTTILKHPIKVKRHSIEATDSFYRGPLTGIFEYETRRFLNGNLVEMGITNELVKNCIELARDKNDRLNIRWVDKIQTFLNS
ncbi:hypothetical protein SteCoe_23344 [Stentor coeruleus]|uniref:Uncharacterized protein n=1 Tax=Stentor coeruleus TaxID=5963 RepID=A0A1R2BK33_9CILI|nr:hypothetical protein SteCoe_23344 [Stentor coeruleus]